MPWCCSLLALTSTTHFSLKRRAGAETAPFLDGLSTLADQRYQEIIDLTSVRSVAETCGRKRGPGKKIADPKREKPAVQLRIELRRCANYTQPCT